MRPPAKFIRTFRDALLARHVRWLLPTTLSLAITSGALAAASRTDDAFFEQQVRPLLAEHCYNCHSGAKTKGGLSLETKAGWSTGGEHGPAIVPGKPEESLLIRAVSYTDADLAMPPKDKGGRLTDAQIAVLEKWVRLGAPDPRVPEPKIAGMNASEAKSWWAFQPLPRATNAKPSPKQIDAFLDARLKAAGLKPAPSADKRALIRRATFDLTGLPPTPEDVEAFVADKSKDAFAKVVDHLLASPQYGEKWGRHWLDVVRYADSLDSRSYDKEGDILDAWRYRDWVVNAFNHDLPYDQFITQQLAGDILAAREWDPQKLVATSVYAFGNWGNGDADKEKVHTDIVDDQIDLTGRAFLGLTLGCARCHDHKFDPITTRDYYGLAGIFFSTRILERFAAKSAGESLMRIPLLSPEQKALNETARQRIAAISDQLNNTLQPFNEVIRDVAGKQELVAWRGKGVDNPSLVINASDHAVAFSTVKLPAHSIGMHPGPKISVTAAWRSPIAGEVRVKAELKDADPNCGDGIAWVLKHGAKTVHSGTMDNGKSVTLPDTTLTVQAGELVQVSIRPRGEYTCDTTEVEFVIEGPQGQRWDLREALLKGVAQGQDNLWWICGGEGAALGQDSPDLARLATERKQLEEQLERTQFTQGMLEGGIPQTRYEGFHNAPVHKRGRYDQLDTEVARGFPAVLVKNSASIPTGSGRLELAQWIASPDNPLTARVMVNRIWQQHFGEGLVRTENNFGKLGTPPTHPELLDWLAAEFIRSGWSMKAMHRLILNSAAYQRSATPPAKAGQFDPENKLLSHQHRRRLEAEELRDAMLAVARRLDPVMGGKAARDILSTRRTLYLTTIRSDRTSYQMLFDGADPTSIVEQRTEATVAPQSLFLLNHPFTLLQAEALAATSARAATGTPERLRWLWQRVFQHDPSAEDRALAERALGANADAARWTAFCQMLLCTNEFAYVD